LRNLRRRRERVSLSLAISGTGHKMPAPPPPIFTASIQSEEMGWRDVGEGGNCHGKRDACLIT